jgi:hypothetical protein
MRPEDQPVAGQDQTTANVRHAERERHRERVEVFKDGDLLRNHREARAGA